jgi:hypothetical protein
MYTPLLFLHLCTSEATNDWYKDFTKLTYGEPKSMPNEIFWKGVDSWLTQKKSRSAQAAFAKELLRETEILDS